MDTKRKEERGKHSGMSFRSPLTEAEKKAKLEAWRAERKAKLADRLINTRTSKQITNTTLPASTSRVVSIHHPATTRTVAKAPRNNNALRVTTTQPRKPILIIPERTAETSKAPECNPEPNPNPAPKTAQLPAVKPKTSAKQPPQIKQTKTSLKRINKANFGVTKFWQGGAKPREEFQKAYHNLKRNPQLSTNSKPEPQPATSTAVASNKPAIPKRKSEAFVVEFSPEKPNKPPVLKTPKLGQKFCTPQVKKNAPKYAFGTGCASLKRVEWKTPKEPSQMDKIANWLKSKGQQEHACKHLSCMTGSVVKPTSKAARKNLTNTSKSATKIHPSFVSSPEVKRVTAPREAEPEAETSQLDTTYDKEEIAQWIDGVNQGEEVIGDGTSNPPVQPESIEDIAGNTNGNGQIEEQSKDEGMDKNMEMKDLDELDNKENENLAEVELKSTGFTLDNLLEEIMTGFKQGEAPDIIRAWLDKTDLTFPGARRQANFWIAKAYLAENDDGPEAALDIYEEAMKAQAEPLDLIQESFETLSERVAKLAIKIPPTPLLQKLAKRIGSQTPRRRDTGLDAHNIIPESVVKYELRVETIFNYLQSKEHNGKAAKKMSRKSMGVPLSTLSDVKLVATPVRRSLRVRKSHVPHSSGVFLADMDEKMAVVDSIDELGPALKDKLVLRENKALESLQ